MKRIGVLINYKKGTDIKEKIIKAQQMGLESCQLSIWDTSLFTEESAEYIKGVLMQTGFRVSAVWAGYSGEVKWNFTEGPVTIGLVPKEYREARLGELMAAADFAKAIGVDKIITHVGFIPEDPNHLGFIGVVDALRRLCLHLKENGQYFLFETGQETPITLLRTIEKVGTGNLGINLDTANPILYGKANPLDALDVFGKYVMNTHIKDGFYPTGGMYLGHESRAGDGKANRKEHGPSHGRWFRGPPERSSSFPPATHTICGGNSWSPAAAARLKEENSRKSPG
mgnify:CR=1 FL=1